MGASEFAAFLGVELSDRLHDMFSLFDEVTLPLPKRDPFSLRQMSFGGFGSRKGKPPRHSARRPPCPWGLPQARKAS